MVSTLPRVLIAAAASGQGKTTVAVGLMAALAGRGHVVAPAKVGPDYIDPGYHALATGRAGRNLDPWLQGEHLLAPLLLHGAVTPTPADVAVIEGVMGLYDGQLGGEGFASSAHVARITDTPVVLVVDISSASRTAAALVHGLASYDPTIRIGGVVLNKAGTVRHADEVRTAVQKLGIPVLGVLPRDQGVHAPSRHLGLVPAQERPDAAAALERLAEQCEERIDCSAVLDIARSAPNLTGTAWDPTAGVLPSDGDRPVVAVAGGRAFTFRYPETDELLRAHGCEPVVFDPAVDEALPVGTRGIYLGGGFPEVHAGSLAGNGRLLAQLRDAVRSGLPTIAECAGMLYLAEAVDGHRLAGVLPVRAAMRPRLTLGYRTATAPQDTLLAGAGVAVRGHEFHRTGTTPSAGTSPMAPAAPAWALRAANDDDHGVEGFSLDPAGTGSPTLHASYLHVHWAGNPAMAGRFADAVRRAPSRALPVTATPLPASHDEIELPAGDPLSHHGDSEVGDLVDFAVNVRSAAPDPWLAARLHEAVPHLGGYPDVSGARDALARWHGVDREMVLLTNGAAEAFTLVAQALGAERNLVVHPQFTEPEAALHRADRPVERWVLDPRDRRPLLREDIASGIGTVLIGNPTNPTGRLHHADDLRALIDPHRVLVVDEAFMDLLAGPSQTLIAPRMQGTVVVRSLTKTWSLAGARVGYVVGDRDLVTALAARQSPWSVNSLAAHAVLAVAGPEGDERVRVATEETALWRTHLERGLRDLDLDPVPSHAPFVLVEVGAGVRELLRSRGYAVRRGDTFPGLGAEWVRIAVRETHATDGLLRALRGVLDRREAS